MLGRTLNIGINEGKSKLHPRISCEGPEGGRGIVLLFL
jgi:hypothetical protein